MKYHPAAEEVGPVAEEMMRAHHGGLLAARFAYLFRDKTCPDCDALRHALARTEQERDTALALAASLRVALAEAAQGPPATDLAREVHAELDRRGVAPGYLLERVAVLLRGEVAGRCEVCRAAVVAAMGGGR